jgi:hypothetical protein
MPHYIVEHEYREPLTDEREKDETGRAKPCLEQYAVTWMASYIAVDRMRQICEFEAESAEHIRNALRSAEVPFARVWQTHKHSR